MKTLIFVIIINILAIFLHVSCEEIKKYSEIPEITFKSFTLSDEFVYDDLGNPIVEGTLTFEFIDGDGDFGSFDEVKEDSINLFFTLYEKIDGEYYHVPEYDTVWNRPILYDDIMAREGQNKTLKGEIEAYLPYYPSTFLYDTFLYNFYIKDRAGHESNVERTDEIVLDWDDYL